MPTESISEERNEILNFGNLEPGGKKITRLFSPEVLGQWEAIAARKGKKEEILAL